MEHVTAVAHNLDTLHKTVQYRIVRDGDDLFSSASDAHVHNEAIRLCMADLNNVEIWRDLADGTSEHMLTLIAPCISI